MKNSFLEIVAHHMLDKYGHNLSRTAVVFPNKRASLFMNESLVRLAGRPIWSPAYITISDLFRQHSQLMAADNIKLVCDLHKSFVKCTGMNESLDHFYGWGQLLLSDFDDIDKNMADAQKVYCNLKDLHALDDLSYLTQEQKALLQEFFHNFDVGNESELKRRFEQLWSRFFDIYTDFNLRLANQGLAYEGALYRHVVDDENLHFDFDRYLFVGFNMTQVVEQRLFSRLQKQGKAFFYWDFDEYYMPQPGQTQPHNEAGHYIAQYLSQFPNELDNHDADIYTNFARPKSVRFISAKTESIQAKYVGEWLRENDRIAAGRNTAVVLANENILQQVLHSLPSEVQKINITTGYPLAATPVVSLLEQLLDLQCFGFKASSNQFAMRYVGKVLSHPYANYISTEAPSLLVKLTEQRHYFPHHNELALDEPLSILFADIASDFSLPDDQSLSPSCQANLRLLRWAKTVLKGIGQATADVGDELLIESVFQTYMLLSRLETLTLQGDLCLDTVTLRRLLRQLEATTSIPFHGEPAVGTQIMGVLETRNLDFDHILLLSCNEGNLPKGINDSSFIPYVIRRAHGLTTIDHKVAIYSYYFHRLLQRASDITITYNNSTADGHASEMSRFMLQLLVEGPHTVERLNLQSNNSVSTTLPQPVEKTPEVFQLLMQKSHLSPSAINKYLRCPLLFFYTSIAGLKEPDATDGDIDNRMFGNIFHRAAQLIYEPFCCEHQCLEVQKDYLAGLLHDEVQLLRIIDNAFNDVLFKTPDGRLPKLSGLQLINRRVIAMYLRNLLQTDYRMAPFRVLALEQSCYKPFTFIADGHEHTVSIGGIIDRMDIVTSAQGLSQIRIIDYKTGAAPKSRTPLLSIEEVFDPQNIDTKHSDYYLQTMLYATNVAYDDEWNPQRFMVSPALLFVRQAMRPDYNPVLSIGEVPIDDIRTLQPQYSARLTTLLEEIFNPNIAFNPTAKAERCNLCPFKKVCFV